MKIMKCHTDCHTEMVTISSNARHIWLPFLKCPAYMVTILNAWHIAIQLIAIQLVWQSVWQSVRHLIAIQIAIQVPRWDLYGNGMPNKSACTAR